MSTGHWALSSAGTREELLNLAIVGEPRDFWLLDHDPLWLSALLDGQGKTVLVARKDGTCFSGLFVHDVGLFLGLGEFSLGTIPVRRYVLTGGLPEKAASAEELAELLGLLATEIKSRGVVFLQGVQDPEALRSALDHPTVRHAYFVLQHGPPYQRCRIALSGSHEAYLASLKAKPRSDLKRVVRNFTGRFGSGMQFEVVTTERDLDAALPDLESLSSKTYQAKLGLGISRGNIIERQLRYGASRGMTRLDLLRVDGRLISFSIAYYHSDTLYAIHRGYDPEWAEWSPGIVHHSSIVEDLCRSMPQIRTFDMMYGGGLYKTRLSNTFHEESHFYLIPRSPRGFTTWLALQTIARASRAASALVEKLKDKPALTRFIRRLAERSSDA